EGEQDLLGQGGRAAKQEIGVTDLSAGRVGERIEKGALLSHAREQREVDHGKRAGRGPPLRQRREVAQKRAHAHPQGRALEVEDERTEGGLLQATERLVNHTGSVEAGTLGE